MPDFTIETAATCWSNHTWETSVRGTGRNWTVRYGLLSATEEARQGYQRGWTCDCPAFIYRKRGECKHVIRVRQSNARCGWNGALDPGLPAAFDEYKGQACCPDCGGPIEYVRVAV